MKGLSFLWLSPALTAIGKKLGIDAHFFAKNSFLVLLGYLVSMVRGVVTGYLVARLFSQQMYGEYQFILSITSMLGFLGLANLGNPVARAWARNERFSLDAITKVQIKVSSIGSMILIGAIPFLQFYNREELWMLFLAAGLLLPLPPVAMLRYGGFTVGKARFDIALKASITWSVLLIIATLAILLVHQSALLMFIAVTSIPSLVYLYFSRNVQPPQGGGKDKTKAIIKYGWQLTFASLPVELSWYMDKLLISQYFGLSQLATFSIALLIPEQAKIFTKQFLPVAFAKQSTGGDSTERRTKLTKAVLIGMAFFGLGIIIYMAICPLLIPLLFPQYNATEVITLTRVAALTLITNPASLFAQYLEAQGMISAIRITQWSAAGIFVIALLILIPSYGLLGAIIARGIFRFAHLGFTWWFIASSPIQTQPLSKL